LESCLASAKEDDALLFLEDGVYYSSHNSIDVKTPQNMSVFALREDISARGLDQLVLSKIEIVNYRAFVNLCVRYDKVINWF
jgi:tRNA 2-thiouridine synthesizing protein B